MLVQPLWKSIYMHFISFSCFTALTKTSNGMFSKSSESRGLGLFSLLRGRYSVFLSIITTENFYKYSFLIFLRKVVISRNKTKAYARIRYLKCI